MKKKIQRVNQLIVAVKKIAAMIHHKKALHKN